MRFVSFEMSGEPSHGVIVPAELADLGRRLRPEFPWLVDFMAGKKSAGATALAGLHADYALDAVKLLPVIPNPKHVFCVALNYTDHFQEVSPGVKREAPSYPAVFLRAADSLTGHGQPIIRSRVSKQLDYESERAVIIGTRGRHISAAGALDYVAGYSCFNDARVRDWQRHTKQATPGKNFFATGALGPWLLTKDEIANPHDLAITTRLHGAVMQNSRTSGMLFDIPTLIAYVPAILPLARSARHRKPGKVLDTGTPGGVGYSRKLPVFLAPGDVVTLEIERAGTLVNTVAGES